MIKAKIIQDSINENGQRITSFELFYPRYCHAELMTHRLFSRNASSSRAIPVKTLFKQIFFNPAVPSVWGKNKPGMQSDEELGFIRRGMAKWVWHCAAAYAGVSSYILSKIGLHKQYANRPSESFHNYKIVVTATDFDNFFALRYHEDAQPEMYLLAKAMYEAIEESTPLLINEGEYHLPYIFRERDPDGVLHYYTDTEEMSEEINLEDALKVSASCCAQVSYRTLDTSVDKAKRIYQRLVEFKPIHASPFEHQATPINYNTMSLKETDGITHIDKNDTLWSGNFKSWIQQRQLIKDNVVTEFKSPMETYYDNETK